MTSSIIQAGARRAAAHGQSFAAHFSSRLAEHRPPASCHKVQVAMSVSMGPPQTEVHACCPFQGCRSRAWSILLDMGEHAGTTPLHAHSSSTGKGDAQKKTPLPYPAKRDKINGRGAPERPAQPPRPRAPPPARPGRAGTWRRSPRRRSLLPPTPAQAPGAASSRPPRRAPQRRRGPPRAPGSAPRRRSSARSSGTRRAAPWARPVPQAACMCPCSRPGLSVALHASTMAPPLEFTLSQEDQSEAFARSQVHPWLACLSIQFCMQAPHRRVLSRTPWLCTMMQPRCQAHGGSEHRRRVRRVRSSRPSGMATDARAWLRSASSHTMKASLPPSSSTSGVRLSAAARITARPTPVLVQFAQLCQPLIMEITMIITIIIIIKLKIVCPKWVSSHNRLTL